MTDGYCIAPGQKNTSWFQTRKFSSLQIHFHWAHKIARLEVVSTSLHLGKNECTFFFYLSSDAGCDGGPFGEPCGPFVRAFCHPGMVGSGQYVLPSNTQTHEDFRPHLSQSTQDRDPRVEKRPRQGRRELERGSFRLCHLHGSSR